MFAKLVQILKTIQQPLALTVTQSAILRGEIKNETQKTSRRAIWDIHSFNIRLNLENKLK